MVKNIADVVKEHKVRTTVSHENHDMHMRKKQIINRQAFLSCW